MTEYHDAMCGIMYVRAFYINSIVVVIYSFFKEKEYILYRIDI